MESKDEYNWHFFDSISCINLISRDDRYEWSKDLFEKYKIPAKFHRVQKHSDPIEGCFNSHVDLISQAYDRGDKTTLIFEDDCVPDIRALTPKNLNKIIEFAEKNKTWDIIYLGCFPNINRERLEYLENGLVRVKAKCTHSYIVSRRMMEKMYNMRYAGCPIDCIYVHNPNTYGIFPTFFQQRGDESDLGGISMKGKNYAMRCIESYAYYVNVPLVILIPAILVMLLILVAFRVPPIWIFFTLVLFFITILLSTALTSSKDCGYYYTRQEKHKSPIDGMRIYDDSDDEDGLF